jgi:hypothetical protein
MTHEIDQDSPESLLKNLGERLEIDEAEIEAALAASEGRRDE